MTTPVSPTTRELRWKYGFLTLLVSILTGFVLANIATIEQWLAFVGGMAASQ